MIYFQSAETHQEIAGKTAVIAVMVWKSQPRNWLCAADGLCASAVAKEKASSPSMV